MISLPISTFVLDPPVLLTPTIGMRSNICVNEISKLRKE